MLLNKQKINLQNQHQHQQTNNVEEITFYTIGDARYFLGVVGLINSLRLTNHQHQIVVLDCGLTPKQQEILSPHCTLFKVSKEQVRSPMHLKPFPYHLQPQGTTVIIDSDMLVTRSLSELFAIAKQGKMCVFADLSDDRYFKEWKEIFALPSAPRKQRYVNSGFLVFSSSHWPSLLEDWWSACERIFDYPTIYENGDGDNPCADADQDALNAILASKFPEDALAIQPKLGEIYGNFLQRVKIVDTRTLQCQYNGSEVSILHSCGHPKPWEAKTVRSLVNRYAHVRLLRRLLTGEDAPIKVPKEDLPVVYRPGLLGKLSMFGLSILNLPFYVMGQLRYVAKKILQK